MPLAQAQRPARAREAVDILPGLENLAWPLERYKEPATFQERNAAYIQTALDLGEQTICALLDHVQMSPQDVDQLTIISTTGISVPSLDARLMNKIPFSRGMKRLPLFGLGCMGGPAGIARTGDYLNGHPSEAVILYVVELCSLTIQRDDLSLANLVASGVFGDGAAAVLMVGDDHPLARPGLPRVIDSQSQFFPATEHIMGWEVTVGEKCERTYLGFTISSRTSFSHSAFSIILLIRSNIVSGLMLLDSISFFIR